MARTRLVPYKQDAFRWNPNVPDDKHSNSSMGYCSLCWFPRKATEMLVRNSDNRAILAYCERHAAIRRVKLQLEDMRVELYESLEQSAQIIPLRGTK